MSHSPLHFLTIKKFHEGLLAKDFSALEMTQEFFKWIEKRDPEVGAYLNLSKDSAARQSEAVDLKLANGEDVGWLAGVPMAVKDNMNISGTSTTAGSRILKDHVSGYDATVIRKLKDSGAVFLGKANQDEFAMG